LLPAGSVPKRHQIIETTDIMLQMVACGRGVAALPLWLVAEYQETLSIVPVRLGSRGISKQIFLGVRNGDTKVDYVADFVRLAKQTQLPARKAQRRVRRRE
jgi:LysR family transcriptional regulator for metE and metH